MLDSATFRIAFVSESYANPGLTRQERKSTFRKSETRLSNKCTIPPVCTGYTVGTEDWKTKAIAKPAKNDLRTAKLEDRELDMI
mgnify:CR=1 FL=1